MNFSLSTALIVAVLLCSVSTQSIAFHNDQFPPSFLVSWLNKSTIMEECSCCKNDDKDKKYDIIQQLTGAWMNATFPFEQTDYRNKKKWQKGAHFHLQFNADGTYEKQFGNKKEVFIESGTYEIANTGTYVLLRSENVFMTAKILHLDMDEMVLEMHSPCEENENFRTGVKQFVFTK